MAPGIGVCTLLKPSAHPHAIPPCVVGAPHPATSPPCIASISHVLPLHPPASPNTPPHLHTPPPPHPHLAVMLQLLPGPRLRRRLGCSSSRRRSGSCRILGPLPPRTAAGRAWRRASTSCHLQLQIQARLQRLLVKGQPAHLAAAGSACPCVVVRCMVCMYVYVVVLLYGCWLCVARGGMHEAGLCAVCWLPPTFMRGTGWAGGPACCCCWPCRVADAAGLPPSAHLLLQRVDHAGQLSSPGGRALRGDRGRGGGGAGKRQGKQGSTWSRHGDCVVFG